MLTFNSVGCALKLILLGTLDKPLNFLFFTFPLPDEIFFVVFQCDQQDDQNQVRSHCKQYRKQCC